MEKLTACPACKSTSIEFYGQAEDWLVSKESFEIHECKDCELKFTNPRPQESDLGKYYESEDYISHSDTKKGLTPLLYQKARQIMLNKKYRLVRKHIQPKTALDIGCGTGYFLSLLQEKGIQTSGVEPSPIAKEIAEAKLGHTLSSQVSEITGTYDLITLWHVLEHLPNLRADLEKISQHLNPNGVLMIAVPNPDSKDAKIYGFDWAAWDLPRHLYHFTKKSLNLLLKSVGFQRVGTYNMPLDSFYVSLLSEKNIGNKVPFPKAIQSGILSNIKGKSSKNQSSLIHVFKKA